jgi:type II secretory pathway pseudopilin PulG
MTTRRAFSLVEMSVLIGILLLLATLVLPNVMRMQDAMAMVTAKSNVVVYVSQAVTEARKSSVTVRLRDDGGALVMESVQGSQDPVEIRSSTFNGKLTLQSVEAPPAEANGDPEALEYWSAYSDGQCDAADLTFTTDTGNTLILRVTKTGACSWFTPENLPDTQAGGGKWAAGDWVPDSAQ